VQLVRGTIRWPVTVAAVPAWIVITLEDTTYADAPAERLAERTVPFTVGFGGHTVAFLLEGGAPASGRRYTLRAVVDLDGDGRVGPGDLVGHAPVMFGDSMPLVVDIALTQL
jgi:uncharacterized lipoprotein YbaY